jgi:threonine/homoserine/homoserine lactone efflux protein
MLNIENLPTFVGVSALVIVTPGPDTAVTIRNTLRGARRGGLLTAVGVSAGQAAWALAASAGVAAALSASEPAFVAVKLAGAAYLIYLGGTTLLATIRSRHGPGRLSLGDRVHVAPLPAFRQGMLSNLGNPKMAPFFLSLLPQFAGGERGSFLSLLTLGALSCCMTLTWLTAYAIVVARAGELLRRTGVQRLMEALMGAVLVGLGLRLATEPSR